jgi:hypothetical protein
MGRGLTSVWQNTQRAIGTLPANGKDKKNKPKKQQRRTRNDAKAAGESIVIPRDFVSAPMVRRHGHSVKGSVKGRTAADAASAFASCGHAAAGALGGKPAQEKTLRNDIFVRQPMRKDHFLIS